LGVRRVLVGDDIDCNEFQGEKQLTAGRFGKLEVIT